MPTWEFSHPLQSGADLLYQPLVLSSDTRARLSDSPRDSNSTDGSWDPKSHPRVNAARLGGLPFRFELVTVAFVLQCLFVCLTSPPHRLKLIFFFEVSHESPRN